MRFIFERRDSPAERDSICIESCAREQLQVYQTTAGQNFIVDFLAKDPDAKLMAEFAVWVFDHTCGRITNADDAGSLEIDWDALYKVESIFRDACRQCVAALGERLGESTQRDFANVMAQVREFKFILRPDSRHTNVRKWRQEFRGPAWRIVEFIGLSSVDGPPSSKPNDGDSPHQARRQGSMPKQ